MKKKTLIDKLCHIVFKEFNLGLAISSISYSML